MNPYLASSTVCCYGVDKVLEVLLELLEVSHLNGLLFGKTEPAGPTSLR